jgi:hypothetical protein
MRASARRDVIDGVGRDRRDAHAVAINRQIEMADDTAIDTPWARFNVASGRELLPD